MGRKRKTRKINNMECIINILSWSPEWSMWIGSSKNYIFAKNCKWVTRCIYRYKKKVTKSHIPALNAPARIDITPAEVTIQIKYGILIGSKDKIPWNRKEQNNAVGVTPIEVINKISEEIVSKIPEEIGSRTSEEVVDKVPEETQAPNDYEISINYVHNAII
jgi:hypothetical protein